MQGHEWAHGPARRRAEALGTTTSRWRTLLALLSAAVLALTLLPAISATAADPADRLDSGGSASLIDGQSIVSSSGQFSAVMQGDGNFVLYFQGRPYWNINRFAAHSRLVMQGDGNLVVYGSDGVATWATSSSDPQGATAVLQSDGNLVVVGHSRGVIWDAGAVPNRLYSGQHLDGARSWTIYSPNRRYRLVMQADGTAVEYDREAAIWSKVGKKPGSNLDMQSDANLVLYDTSRTALWISSTSGPADSYLEAQDDGNFVVYTPQRTALWGTRTDMTPAPGGPSGSAPVVGAEPASVADAAKQILALRNSGRITTVDYSEGKASDTADRSLASQQLTDLAAGKRANFSLRCSYAGQYIAVWKAKSTAGDLSFLRFLVALGNSERFGVNVLFGQCHSSVNSAHHAGQAADLACTLSSAQVAVADSIGAKYGVKRNFETCAKNKHWHYSVGGH